MHSQIYVLQNINGFVRENRTHSLVFSLLEAVYLTQIYMRHLRFYIEHPKFPNKFDMYIFIRTVPFMKSRVHAKKFTSV